MRIPKAILGVISAWLKPSEIHTLLLFYKYDTMDVLKIAMVYGVKLNNIICYPKWPTYVYFECIKFAVCKPLALLVRKNGCGGDYWRIQCNEFVSKYGDSLRNSSCNYLFWLLVTKYNTVDYKYRSLAIKYIITAMDYSGDWCTIFNDPYYISKPIIETQDINVLHYLFYRRDYCPDFDYNTMLDHDDLYCKIFNHKGFLFENGNFELYNYLMKMHYKVCSSWKIYELHTALKCEYYDYAYYLIDEYEDGINYTAESIPGVSTKGIWIIDAMSYLYYVKDKKRYLDFIMDYFKFNKQDILYILDKRCHRGGDWWYTNGVDRDDISYKYVDTTL